MINNNFGAPTFTEDFGPTIAKIRKKKRAFIIISCVAAAIVVLLGSEYYTPDGYVQLLGTLPTALLLLGILLFSLISTALTVAPLANSLLVECDPKKHIALNTALNKGHYLKLDMASSYLLLGDYATAENYYNQFTSCKNASYRFMALFGKARCQFFLGNGEHLDACYGMLKKLLETEKLSARRKTVLTRQLDTMALMCALTRGNKEEIAAAKDKLKAWDEFKPSEAYFHYFSGIAAKALGDKENEIYHLAWVKNNAGKTMLAELSSARLTEIEIK